MKPELRFELISHASVMISYDGVNILTDPWFGFPFHYETFHMYPPFSRDISSLVSRVTAVHISHLHQDHFCKKSLSYFPRDTLILIARYKGRYFLEQLKTLGFSNIIELDNGFETGLHMGGLVLRTLQAENNETSLDSALFVTDPKENHFLLANDCRFGPLQRQEMKDRLKKIRGGFLSYTHVYPYPTCFSFEDNKALGARIQAINQERTREFEAFCNELELDWAVPYANDLRFLNSEIFKHNRIFDNPYPISPKATRILQLRHGSIVNDNGTILPETQLPCPDLQSLIVKETFDEDLSGQFDTYEGEIRQKLKRVVASASENWEHPMAIRFIIEYGKKSRTIDFNSERGPDLVLKYNFKFFKLFCDGKINWIRLHTTYHFEASILNSIPGQTQPLLWKVQ